MLAGPSVLPSINAGRHWPDDRAEMLPLINMTSCTNLKPSLSVSTHFSNISTSCGETTSLISAYRGTWLTGKRTKQAYTSRAQLSNEHRREVRRRITPWHHLQA